MTPDLSGVPPKAGARDLPSGWARTTLGEAFKWGSGGTPLRSRTEFYNGSIPWAVIGDLNDGVVSETASHLSEEGLENSSAKWVEPGSVLLAMYGSIGKLGIAGTRITTNQAIAFTKPDPIEPKYLFYYLRSERDNLVGLGGGATQLNISQTIIKAYPFVVAPLPEQGRIVAKIEELLSQLDAGVAALKRAQAGLKRYKASVLQAACEGHLVPQDPSEEPAAVLLERILAERRAKWEADLRAKGKDPEKAKYVEPKSPDTQGLPKLPEGWCWASLDQLADHSPHSVTDGPFGSNLKTEHYRESGPRVLRLQNIGQGLFNDERAHIGRDHFDRLRRYEVFAGDLVIAALGESLPRACIIPWWVGDAIVKADCIRFKPHPLAADVRYLNAVLNSEMLKRVCARIIHGVGRPRMNQQEIRTLPIPVPPLAEQRRISVEIDRHLSTVEELDAALRSTFLRAQRLMQGVLRRAFEGHLVPQHTNEEPAAILLERIIDSRGRASQAGASRMRRRAGYRPVSAGRKDLGTVTVTWSRRSLHETLLATSKDLTPNELFGKAGSSTDTVDQFYEELRAEVARGRIVEVRPNDTEVLLRAVAP
jgi:type I restriction enzyme S subunit